MILILSQDSFEATTEFVADWIRALGGDCVRLNGEDLTGSLPFRIEVDEHGPLMRFELEGRTFTHRDVGAVWLRRWHAYQGFGVRSVPGHATLAHTITAHLVGETRALSRAFFAFLRQARWLTRPDDAALSKLDALHAAAAAGLDIPPTLITNQRAEIERFRRLHGRVITKSIGDGEIFEVDERYWGMYTAEVEDRHLAEVPETVFPSLVQALVEKELEVRVFYLDGELYAMAIFSQSDAQTAMDFRHYNLAKPVRQVPYRLPDEVAAAVRRTMESLGLATGSLDLVRTPDGRHVFLEVNPAGQFGMVSNPCNYRLEKRVAEYLIERERSPAHA